MYNVHAYDTSAWRDDSALDLLSDAASLLVDSYSTSEPIDPGNGPGQELGLDRKEPGTEVL